ncbi:MAG: condensation domain-containing protein, partial [Bacteroidota bacterium]
NECEGIKTAIVLPKESNGLLQLVGYLLKEGEVTEEELVQQLEQRMPAYMIPSYFIEIDEIPLTVNGKANRKALLAMERSAGKKFIACEGVEENRLANIWKEVLGIEQIGAKDSFFQIGGDSILAIRLIARINRDFETQINVNDLYEHDCIRSLANVVAENEKREQDAAWQEAKEELLHFNKTQLTKRADDNILAVYPMSDIAKAMCYAQLNRPEDCLYIEQMVQPVTFKNFQADKLIHALALLVDKHETFRTGFDLSEFAHIIYRKVDVSVPLIDLSDLDKETQRQQIQSHLEEGRQKGFDMLAGPLWRFRLYKLSDTYFELVVEQHHAIFDGWSFASFYTELNNLYVELCKKDIDRLEMLKSSYADAILQELYNKKDETARNFWKRELADYQRLRIPQETDKQSFSSIRKSYPNALSSQLNRAAERHQTSIKTILQAAYIYALSALSGQRDVLTGLVTFSRPLKEDGDKILGCFLNTTPFRIVIPEQITWAEYLAMVIRKHHQIRKYESLSLFEISQIVGRHGREENPFFDTYFNYIHWHITKEMEEVEQSEDVVEEHDVFLRGNTFFDASYEWRNDRVYCLSEYMSPYFSEAIFQKYEQAFLHAIFCLAETPALEMDGIEPESISLEADVLQSDEKSIHQGPFVRANTPTEKLLTSIWAKILRMEADEISINQSFFDLGGNSLTAMSMIQTILKHFNITLSMRQLFSANTIEEIARFIDGELWLKQQPQTANSSDSEQFIL